MNTAVEQERSNNTMGKLVRFEEVAESVSEQEKYGPSTLVSKLIDFNSTLLKFNCLTIDGVLTVRRARLLWTLASLDHAPCLTELTEMDNAGSTQNCGRILGQLDENGFLAVRSDSVDGRMLRVYITDKGRKAAESFGQFAVAFGTLLEREVEGIDIKKMVTTLDAFETIIASPRMSDFAPVDDSAPNG
ncbi:hypothetical protein [Raoultibacter phocaeensis]|uniref:hypothetical protein n=1 Tax=Raoultibacter phocaeensis TaxID=2479841 RepID=UPI00111A0112|nr:hypothetical protein [Raoultibacter phocaeensis]